MGSYKSPLKTTKRIQLTQILGFAVLAVALGVIIVKAIGAATPSDLNFLNSQGIYIPGQGTTPLWPNQSPPTIPNIPGWSQPQPDPVPVPTPAPPATPAPTPVTAKPAPKNPATSTAQVAAPATTPADTEPPTTPTNLVISKNTNGDINLTWTASHDNAGVGGYLIERSVDEQTWVKVGESGDSAFTDTTASFGRNYSYRVMARDTAGNISNAALAKILTATFGPNADPARETHIEGAKGSVNVVIPAGALTEQAFCETLRSRSKVSLPEGKVFSAGPYRIRCKNEAGKLIESFQKPLTYKVKVSGGAAPVYLNDGKQWKQQPASFSKKDGNISFNSDKPVTFAVLAANNQIPLSNLAIALALLVACGGLTFQWWYHHTHRRLVSIPLDSNERAGMTWRANSYDTPPSDAVTLTKVSPDILAKAAKSYAQPGAGDKKKFNPNR